MVRKLGTAVAATMAAGLLAVSAAADHLRVQVVTFETTLVPTAQSIRPEVWQERVANLARDPTGVAEAQFSHLSTTAAREIRVAWGLICFPNSEPPVDTISYSFSAKLREVATDALLPSAVQWSIITTRPSGSDVLPVTAGTAVVVRAEAHCGGWGVGPGSGGLHGSGDALEHRGPTIVVPPYVPLPALLVQSTSGRSLAAGRARYKHIRGRTLPRGRTVFVVPSVAARVNGAESLEIVLRGAGISVTRTVGADDVATGRRLVIKVLPRRRGTIQYWTQLRPYGVRSNVVSLLVR